MSYPNLDLLERAAAKLQPVLPELVFVDGCATGLLIQSLLFTPRFLDALPGYLLQDQASQARVGQLLAKLKALAIEHQAFEQRKTYEPTA